MRVRSNIATERRGVNFARDVVERAGCLFKEVNLQHDFGQDATIMLVVEGKVLPREIALQIKSGSTYVNGPICRIPASTGHVEFWAEHDLVTLGVVYDPAEDTAYWTDLQVASRSMGSRKADKGVTFRFAKAAWNRFDDEQFPSVLLPMLLEQAPTVALETLVDWVASDDPVTHDLGVRALRARHYKDGRAWTCMVDDFLERNPEMLTMQTGIALAMLMGHDDLGFHSGAVPHDVRTAAMARVLDFGPREIAKVLGLIEDDQFDRASDGYSLLPVVAARADCVAIWETIKGDVGIEPRIRGYANVLLGWHRSDPDWFGFWRRPRL